jgi:hypothetical protein
MPFTRKASRRIVDGIESVWSFSKALEARGMAAGLRAMESDLGEITNTNSPQIHSDPIKDGLSGVIHGVVRVFPRDGRFTGAEVSAELTRLLREQSEDILASLA